jgi:hypothetical protein
MSRGGNSRVLEISCSSCKTVVTHYQKDGPGILKRMYVDRFINNNPKSEMLTCPNCKESLGMLYDYKKENRPAYKLFTGAITKKVVSANKI